MNRFSPYSKLLVITLLHLSLSLVSQETNYLHGVQSELKSSLAPISSSDSLALSNLPHITSINTLLSINDLPAVVDNSTQPYFRPLFEQVASECGQYASIGFNFTYEMNYVRNTDASLPENQYPTHYTYNFMNGGFGWHGVSYFHSFEIAKVNGHPSVSDFGTNNSCGPSYWMNGYESYLNGMSNKIDEVYQIRTLDESGLEILKNWLHNHLIGDDVGGIACFYSGTPWNLNTLPANSPEAGKKVMTNFVYPASHASTITGYNDSIRYDYNGDGMFTNDIDINQDGLVNMKDWEIGGLRFTDSYLGGINWADSGFCYMMYKTLADRVDEGGIWNNVVHVVKIKEDYQPLLSMKVKIRYNCREAIKVVAGVSSLPDASYPEHTLGFPIFDFQGGCQFMQGGWEQEAKTIEFGLDITPLLGRIQGTGPSTFFLQVVENDPQQNGSGEILNFAIVDNMNEDAVYEHPSSLTPILDNDVTSMGITATLDFETLNIENQQLEVALTGEAYSQQMNASGGTPPYKWNLVESYDESIGTSDYPPINTLKFQFPDTVNSLAPLTLPFSFPFYGELHDTIWVHTDGFIMFDAQTYPWPYLYDERLMIRKTKIVATFLKNNLYIDESNYNGVWYEGNNEQMTIRWKVTAKPSDGTLYDFVLKIYADGNIEYLYNFNIPEDPSGWAAGISKGDDISYQYPDPELVMTGSVQFLAREYPHEMTLTESGLFSGTTLKNYPGIDLLFQLEDHNLLNSRKTLKFYSFYNDVLEAGVDLVQQLIVSPNPAREQIHVKYLMAKKGNVEMRLYSTEGILVYQLMEYHNQEGTFESNINTGDIPQMTNGTYFLTILQEDGVMASKKIVILK